MDKIGKGFRNSHHYVGGMETTAEEGVNVFSNGSEFPCRRPYSIHDFQCV